MEIRNITQELIHHPEYMQHEKVVRFEDAETGLRGFVAIHNSNLGSATGGTRMFPYASEEDALKDVLRLSRAMTYKCAMAGVLHGGGKAVIMGNPQKDKTPQLLQAYAKVIGQLNGEFSTGEDVGISEQNVQDMLEVAPFFVGKRGLAGDPSPYASLSTFYAIQAISRDVFGNENIRDKKIAIKGIGKVGAELVRLLKQEGAKISIADIDSQAVLRIQGAFPDVEAVSPDTIHQASVDIFAPCAMGNEFRESNKEEIRAKIICGAANNQIESPEVGDWLFERGIIYVPDYVANAGGVINVVDELEPGGYNQQRVQERIFVIKDRVHLLWQRSQETHKGLHRIADSLAEEIFMA